MSSTIEAVKQFVQNTADKLDYKYHIESVVRHALHLADMLHADKEVVELAAYLHDIGRQKEKGDEYHHLLGERYAREILIEHNVPTETINRVCLCIRRHRASKEDLPQTLEEEIIANADAMSHFEMIPLFFYWGASQATYEEAQVFVKKKLARDWEEKLTLKQARELTLPFKEAAERVLGTFR